jgi:metallo-beta-lactamase class B
MKNKETDMSKQALIGLLVVVMGMSPGAQEKIELRKDVEIFPLAPGIWRHVTYMAMEEWGMVPANGLIVVDGEHAVMIDTPWTPGQTAILLDWVEKDLKAKVEAVVVGHHHVDCLGGLSEAHRRGIASISLNRARELALAEGIEAPKETFTTTRQIMVGKRELELFYPGAGHTVDNIVTWIADEKVLFGGCLVKSGDARALGYIKEADLAAWPATLAKVKARYPEARLIVPGHGDPGGWELLDNTLRLTRENSKPKREKQKGKK